MRPEQVTKQERPADGPRLTVVEGTVIETVLVTRLNGTQAGPVTCLVTTPVYSADRQHVLIPAGARVLGNSSPVQTWGDSRLAVSFHRLLMPDGHTYSLDTFHALDQVGEAGVHRERRSPLPAALRRIGGDWRALRLGAVRHDDRAGVDEFRR